MQQERFDELLNKYLTGSLNSAEESELARLVNLYPQLKNLKESAVSIWHNSEQLSVLHRAEKSKDKDYKKVCERIRNSAMKQRWSSRFISARKYAAVIAFFVVGASGYWMYMNLPGFGRWQAVTAHNQVEIIELPDHSTVALNKDSRIVYLKSSTESKRRIKLKGEAYFEVAHDKSKTFTVENGAAKVMVLGTSFNVKTDSKDGITEVSVVDGNVKFSYGDASLLLKKGETGYYKNGKLEKVARINNDFDDWKSDVLNFSNNSLDEVINTLNLYFAEIKSVNNYSTNSTVKITTRFENQSINDIFSELSLHFNKKFELKDGILTISD